MAIIDNINTGTVPNDGTGDPLRDAFVKTNSNFQNLNNQSNENANKLTNDKLFSETKTSAGDQIFTIADGGYIDTNYEYTFNAYDANGFEVVGVRRVSKTSTTITLNLPQPCTVTINTKKS